MNENEFEHEGVIYVAMPIGNLPFPYNESCGGCAIDRICRPPCAGVKCCPSERTDGRHVIFVEKQS